MRVIAHTPGDAKVLSGLALAGFVSSWVLFCLAFAGGLSFFEFWRQALWAGGTAGLTWDLIACGLMVSWLAWGSRATLGRARLAVVIGSTWSLGVCVGFGFLAWFLWRAGSSRG